MFTGSAKELTGLSRRFFEPANSTHRQYEALRAFFVDGLPAAEAAARFGYTPGSFRVLVHQFRNQPEPRLLRPHRTRGPPAAAKQQTRCGNRSSPCASRTSPSTTSAAPWPATASPLSPAAVAAILKDEGFAKLPRRARRRAARPTPPRHGRCRRCPPARPDARGTVRTKFGGLFLFLPDLARSPTWTASSAGAASPARRWSRPPAPCGRCWP